MDLELGTIGTELLLGFTIDSNAAELARALATVGARVVRRATVGDQAAEIAAAVTGALERTGFVITTGGLGPTRDDISKRAVAELFGVPLELDEAHLARLREGRPESIETSALHIDILRDLKRIHSHICAVAYPVLEAAHEPAASAARRRDQDPAASHPGRRAPRRH